MNINTLKYSINNPRKITKENLEKLKKSIKYYTETIPNAKLKDGYRLPNPIIINDIDNEILSGNQRVRALKELGTEYIKDEDIRKVHITDERKKEAFILRMNKHDGDWQDEHLQEMLNELSSMDDWEDLTGFDVNEIIGNIDNKKTKTIGKKYYNGLDSIDDYYKEKVIYRIMSCFDIDNKNTCIELFSGKGILTNFYRKIFNTVVTNDKNIVGNDYNCSAIEFIDKYINDYSIDMIDFDDEGMPQLEIQKFFEKYNFDKNVIINITDGGIINAKIKSKIDFKKYYLINVEEDKEYYNKYEDYNFMLIEKLCKERNLNFDILYSIRKNNQNCIYQGFKIKKPE